MGIFEGKKGPAQTCLAIDILNAATQQGQHRYSADTSWGVLDGVNISANWRIRLNYPCAVAMQPYVRLL